MGKQYLDDSGNPIATPAKTYLDDNGNPIQPKNQAVPQATLDNLRAKSAQPTQFEQDRNPANQPGVIHAAASEIGNMLMGLPSAAKSLTDPIGSGLRGAADLAVNDQLRQVHGRSPAYRAAAAAGSYVGANAPKMEQQADIGNARGVLGTAIGDAAPAGASLYAPAVVSKAANVLKNSSYGTMNNALGVFGRDMTYGANPGRGVVQEGIMGTQRGMLDKIGSAVSANGDELQQAANRNAHVPVNIESSVKGPLAMAYEKGVDGVAPSDYLRRIQKTAGELTQQRAIDPNTGNFSFNGEPKNLASANPPEVLDYRRGIKDRTNFATDSTGQNVNPILKNIYGGVTRDLHAAVPEMAPIDSRLADLIGAKEALSKTVNRRLASPGIASVGNVPGEILGAAAGGPIGAAVGGAGNFAARTMPFRSSTAQGLYQMGNAANRVAPLTRPGLLVGQGLYGRR